MPVIDSLNSQGKATLQPPIYYCIDIRNEEIDWSSWRYIDNYYNKLQGRSSGDLNDPLVSSKWVGGLELRGPISCQGGSAQNIAHSVQIDGSTGWFVESTGLALWSWCFCFTNAIALQYKVITLCCRKLLKNTLS